MIELPPNYLDNFTKIDYSDIKKGDYILYKTKARPAYNKGVGPSTIKSYPTRWAQGYVSLVPDEEGVAKFGEEHREVLGFIGARRKSWSTRKENLVEIYRSNLDPKNFKKGRKKKPEEAAPPKKRGRPKKKAPVAEPEPEPPSPPSPPAPPTPEPVPEPPAKKTRKKRVTAAQLAAIEAQKIVENIPSKRVPKKSKKQT